MRHLHGACAVVAWATGQGMPLKQTPCFPNRTGPLHRVRRLLPDVQHVPSQRQVEILCKERSEQGRLRDPDLQLRSLCPSFSRVTPAQRLSVGWAGGGRGEALRCLKGSSASHVLFSPPHGYLSEGFFSLALGCMACLGDWPTVKAKVPRTC